MAMGSISLDGPTYLMWGALLVFGLLSLLIFSERDLDNGSSAFAASAASVPGSIAEAEANTARHEHTEVFPLALFCAVGNDVVFLRIQRPDHDVRRARGHVAPAVPAVRDGRAAVACSARRPH